MGGAQLQLIVADIGGKSTQAAREALRLSEQEQVDVIIGSLISNDRLAITRAVDDNHVPTLSLFAGGSQTPYAYSVGFSYDDGYAANLADFVIYLKTHTNIPAKRATLAYANYEAGQQINKFLKACLVAAGVDLNELLEDDIQEMTLTANLTPRKCLGCKIPL